MGGNCVSLSVAGLTIHNSSIPCHLFIHLCTLLILYIVVSLLYTFRYRHGLSAEPVPRANHEEFSRAELEARVAKELVKAKKKRAKAEAKVRKKVL